MSLVPDPALSEKDPDAFGIKCRNLIENALRHGTPGTLIKVGLTGDGMCCVVNDSEIVSAPGLDVLARRHERGGTRKGGSGLGLAIVGAIAERISSRLALQSPAPGRSCRIRGMFDPARR